MRTQDEIVARIRELSVPDRPSEDLFGFGRSVLFSFLDFEHALEVKSLFKGDVTREDWEKEHPESWRTDESVLAEARAYNDFAWGKVRDHRGLSAMRNITKMSAWAWLLGKDDLIAAAEAVEYENYGAPQLRILAEGLGFSMPDEECFHRMARGERCRPDCDEGCGT